LTNGIAVDVTSLIGAEDYLTSQNRRTHPQDPFARQCFVEVIQTLLFIEDVFVAHPVRGDPQPEDFGLQPHLLQELIGTGLLRPLQLDPAQWSLARAAEADAISDLKDPLGTRSVVQFIDQALACDSSRPGGEFSLSARLRRWSDFHRREVRVAGHHQARIDTGDGVEEDGFGTWARAAAVVLEGSLEAVAPRGEGSYLMATLARGPKYRVRAEAALLSYQPHPMRRDFSLTFGLNQRGAESNLVFDVIKAVRGIHESLTEAAGRLEPFRLQVLELELPLLGGRLWRASEAGRLDDQEWIKLVVARIANYRERVADLRAAISACVTEEDYVRLARDIEGVRNRLLDGLGLRRTEPSRVEQELINSVASVTRAVTGVPVVRGLYFGTKDLGGKLSRRFRGKPFEQFLYREFIRAWRIAGR
jgi:hypothetical protein